MSKRTFKISCPRCEHSFRVEVELPSGAERDARPEAEKLYSLRELEDILSLSRRTLREMVGDGRLKAFQAGGRTSPWYVRASDLREFREKREGRKIG